MKPSHAHNHGVQHQGFTLLEVLVSILIFGVVMSSLFISFRSLMFEPDGIQQTLSREETARAALDRMVSDLQAIYVPMPPLYRPPETNDPPHPHRLKGEVDFTVNREFGRLQFASLAHLPMRNRRQQGIARITYYVQEDSDDSYALRRADHLPPYPEEVENDPVLCEDVQALVFEFFDEDGDLHEVWDSDAREYGRAMPAAVGIRLQLSGEENPAVFETRVHLPVQRGKTG